MSDGDISIFIFNTKMVVFIQISPKIVLNFLIDNKQL